MQLGGAAAALAVSGFGEVGQLEITGERLGDAVGIFYIEGRDDFARPAHLLVFQRIAFCGVLALANQELSQLLHNLE